MVARTRAMLFALGLFAGAPGFGQSAPKGAPAPADAKLAPCAACHGTSEKAPLPGMPSLSGQQAEFLAAQLFFIREGLRNVPQMEGMLKGTTDRDLTDMAAYFSKQRPLRVSGKPDPQVQSRGAALVKRQGCGTCHMPDFSGQRQIPRINAQREDYLAAALKAYRDNQRSGSDTSMNAVMHGVSDSDILTLAHYLAYHP